MPGKHFVRDTPPFSPVTEGEEKLWLDNIQLRQQAHYYQSLHERALAKQNKQAAQIQVLKAKVAELQKRLFGRKCERDFSSEAWVAKRRRRCRRGQQRGAPGHGRQRQDTLPVENVVVEGPEEWRVCARCGLPLEPDGTAAAHEEIQWEVRLVRKRYRCQRYQRTCGCEGVPRQIVVPAPARLISKGRLSLGTIVEMLRLKFKYQLPLQRILGMGKDYGLILSPGTGCGIWQKLEPLFVEQPEIPMGNNGAHAARGMSDIMPRAGLCRVALSLRRARSKSRMGEPSGPWCRGSVHQLPSRRQSA